MASEILDNELLSQHQKAVDIIEHLPDLQKQAGGQGLVAPAGLAVVSATLAYDRESGFLGGWITYPFDPIKIRFVSTSFTVRQLSFHGTGGFVNVAMSRQDLVGKRGKFFASGNKEVSALRLWLDDKLVFAPLFILGQGGNGHLAEGEVLFTARE